MYQTFTALERPDLYEAFQQPSHPLSQIWPAYMGGTSSKIKYWHLLPVFPETARFQIMVVVPDSSDGTGEGVRIVARANAIPFHRPVSDSHDLAPLPDGGMDEALQLGMELHLNRNSSGAPQPEANTLSALSIAVDPAWRNKGIAGLLVKALRQAAADAGLWGLVVPARPTLKHRYPDVGMAEYVQWTSDGGSDAPCLGAGSRDSPFDPWLRRHVQLGARMVKIAPRSMTVEADAETWTRWLGADPFAQAVREASGRQVDESGQEVFLVGIPQGLVKLRYWPSTGIARYVEPNVWMEYDELRA
ncbi:hypothetical protein CDD83_4997 [Cordyceps sp. RAO-2017]|nr:hypothetical protein CDD83_4997 [Cordyceps sp. RAO-2017]